MVFLFGIAIVMRPQFVLFGDSITEQSFRPGGWGAALADTYSRKVLSFFFVFENKCYFMLNNYVYLWLFHWIKNDVPMFYFCLFMQADVVVRGYGGYNTRWALYMLNHLFPLARVMIVNPFMLSFFVQSNQLSVYNKF